MFKNKLLDLMAEKSISSQRQLSLLTDIPTTTISGWINAGRLPDYSAIKKLSKFFNISTDELLEQEDFELSTRNELFDFETEKREPNANSLIDFSDRLTGLIEEKNITQNELAQEIGYTQRAVSKWVNGQAEPTESAIVKCAKYFEVSTDYLLGLTSDDGAELYSPPTTAPIGDTLTREERELVERYRALDDKLKKIVMDGIKVYGGANELVSKSGKKV